MPTRKKTVHIRNPRPKKAVEYVYDPYTIPAMKRREAMKYAAKETGQKGLVDYMPIQRDDSRDWNDNGRAVAA